MIALDDYKPLADRLRTIRAGRPRRWVNVGWLGTAQSARSTRHRLARRYGHFGFLFRVADDGRSIETFWREPRRTVHHTR